MRLFSTRKSNEKLEGFGTTAHDNAVVRVIRSRFYGKGKGKERESPNMSYIPSDASPSQTLSGPSLHLYSPSPSSPLSQGKSSIQSSAAAGPSSPRVARHKELASPLLTRCAKRPHPSSPDLPPLPPPKSPTNEQRQRERDRDKDDTPTKSPILPASPPKKPTDSVTVTLAQKLNELAVANSEGLLNDEEYRLLRQNLFERFSSTAVVPAETPVVPVSKPKPRENMPPASTSRPASGSFPAEIPQSPSRTSLSSGVASILRRATARRSNPAGKDTSDTASLVSQKSSVFKIPRTLARKLSISSVNTFISQAPTDSISITSRRTNVGSNRLRSDSATSLSPTGTRSAAGSIRKFNTPPSSFRGIGLDNKSTFTGVYDDDRLQTSQEIKQEILAVEAEAKSMMDAFNGLELTALAKLQKQTGRNSVVGPSPEGGNMESSWALVPDGQSQRMIIDNDSTSVKSGVSTGTSARSAYSSRKAKTKKSLGSPLLHRQNSSSSFNSSRAGNGGLSYGHLGSKSNLSLTRTANQISTRIAERGEDKEILSIGNMEEDEMEDIRRRREEVMMRYEARLEYLRARLKGAQLHEKLLRK